MTQLPPDAQLGAPPRKASPESVLAAPRTPVTRWNRKYLILGATGLASIVALGFYLGFGGLSRNTELDLNLRTLVGGGYGRYFVQTNTADWLGGVGLAYSNEHYTGEEQFNSLEAVFYTTFSIFRYDFPETDIGGTLSLLPSLTKSGRYRAEGDLHAKYEFVDDLYFELRLWGSFDSDPPIAGATKSDYGLVTSLGYSF